MRPIQPPAPFGPRLHRAVRFRRRGALGGCLRGCLVPSLVATGVLAGVAVFFSRCDDGSASVPGGVEYFEAPDAGETRLRADLDLGLGHVEVVPAERGYLFQAEVSFDDAGGARPRFSHTAAPGGAGHLALSLDHGRTTLRGLRRGGDGRWRIYLGQRVPLDLRLALGAADAELDLTGVPLRRLDLQSGLARTHLRFTAPNPEVLDLLRIEAGLAEFTAEGLGHARFRRLDFEGGLGQFTLDFTGAPLRTDARADVRAGVSELTLVLPEGQPLHLTIPDAPGSRLELPPGFRADGPGRWLAPGTAPGAPAFELAVEMGPGQVDVRFAE